MALTGPTTSADGPPSIERATTPNPTQTRMTRPHALEELAATPSEGPTVFRPKDVSASIQVGAFRSYVNSKIRDTGMEMVTMLDHEGNPVTKPRIEWVIEAIYTRAEAGDLRAAQDILDRTIGKAAQPISVEEGTQLMIVLKGSGPNPVSMDEL